jgi:hypothetical protein
MAAQKWGRPPPRDAANGLLNCHSRAGVDKSINSTQANTLQRLRAAWISRRCAVVADLTARRIAWLLSRHGVAEPMARALAQFAFETLEARQ